MSDLTSKKLSQCTKNDFDIDLWLNNIEKN